MLSHLDESGRPRMVDVGDKTVTRREATAHATVVFPPSVAKTLQEHAESEWVGPKGPIFATAIVAGIQAVKRTWELIPLCHPLPLDGISVTCQPDGDRVEVKCTVKSTHKTGVEMEALTGASIAALTIYDMTKALSHEIVVERVELLKKTGGKSDYDR